MNKVTELKEYFRQTLSQVSEILDIPEADITRDDYVRITVDHDIENRLNKEELKAIGGYAKAKQDLNLIKAPKILVLDIETSPIIAHVWQLFENNVALNQIEADWFILSWAAKWLGDPEDKVFYMDQRNSKDIENDKAILKPLWDLMNEADFILGQNVKRFDVKKINARFIQNDFPPPSSYRQLDTQIIAKAIFGFTSNKLEYMADKLCTKYKKLSHAKFPGHKMWVECLKGNKEAFQEMEEYNKHDILATEELYLKLRAWDKKGPNINVFHDSHKLICACGSIDFKKNGFVYSNTGKFQRHTCKQCGAEVKDKTNLLSKEKRKSLKSN